MSQNPNLFLSVGKQVRDEYGRAVGKIASFAVTPIGKFEGVYIESGNGKFNKHSAEYLKFDGENITLISSMKAQANILCDQIPLIWRKDQALKGLAEKNKTSEELYAELHSNFESILNQLKNDAKTLMAQIDDETARCAEEMKALNYALVHLEIEHEVGKIDNQYYETAFTIIQDNLKRIQTEKTDLDLSKSKLSNTLLGETPEANEEAKSEANDEQKESAAELEASELPEPPVVVYVKEIGKTGI
jgi:chromosome segregation ATPase